MNWSLYKYIFCILFSISFCALHAQEYLLDIEHFTVEDGLSHNQVQCIYEDSRGIIWIGTTNGLNRFDGESFKHFTKEAHGLFENKIIDIYEDKDGMLWLMPNAYPHLSKEYSITIFNPFKEKAEEINRYLGQNFPVDFKSIAKIGQRANHDLLLFTADSMLMTYSGHLKIKEEEAYKMPFRVFYQIPYLIDEAEDMLWLGGQLILNTRIINFGKQDSLLFKMDLKGNTLKPDKFHIPEDLYHFNFREWNPTANVVNFFTTYDPNGTYAHCHTVNDSLRKLDFWQNEKKLDFSKAGFLKYWNKTDGLMVFLAHEKKQDIERRLSLCFVQLKGASDVEVLSQIDIPVNGTEQHWTKTKDSYWYTSAGNGLYRLKIKPKRFQAFNVGEQQRNLVKDENNRIWLRAYEKLTNDNYFNPELGAGYPPESLVKDQNDCIWGIDYNHQHFIKACPPDYSTQYLPNGTLNYKLSERGYLCFNKDRKNQIWLFPQGYLLNTAASAFQPFRENTALDTLDFKTTYHVWQDSQEHFWMATGGALFHLDKNLNLLGTYNQNGKDQYYLPTNEVHHFHVDAAGIFWLGTAHEGLIRWDKEKAQIRQFTRKDGLPSNIIHAVYEDDYGYLWLNSESGIIRFNKENFTFVRYGMEAGISHFEGNSRSHLRDEDGTFYFGSLVGVTKFHPKDFINDEEAAQPTEIEIMTIYQKDVLAGETINLLPNFIETGQLELVNRQAFLEITFVPPDIEVMKTSRFEYQFGGGQDKWIELDKNRFSLADLPYGNLDLKARNRGFNGHSTNILTIPIFNPAPIYLQWWFIVLSLIGVVLTAVIYGRVRTQNLKRQKTILQAEVNKQTKELKQQAEELRSLDKTKSRFFANVSHELRTPITLIKGPIQKVLKNQDVSNQDFILLKKAQLSTDRLLKMVNEILDLTKLESGKLELNEAPVVIYPALQRMISVFESRAQSKDIQLEFHSEVHPSLQIQLDREKLETIFNNLMTNALKFTPKGGKVTVHLKDLGHHLQLSVEDNGRGIHPDDLPHIFDRFYQTKRPDAPAEGGTGIGLALSAELAKLFTGKIWAESSLETGSTFFFEFPKKEVFGVPAEAMSSGASVAGQPEGIVSKVTKKPIETVPSDHPQKPPYENNASKPAILLVEDNYHLRDYIQMILSEKYEVVAVENGEEALKWLTADGQPSLILSDVMMPVMDGFQLLEQLKSDDRYRHIPVIMLTARAEMKNKLKALRIGVDDYMVKPFEEEELLVRIENLLNNREAVAHYQLSVEAAETSEEPQQSAMSQQDLEWLETLEQTILEKLSDFDFNVEQLAYAMAMSKSSLERKIKSLVGLSPSKYIQEVRFEKARQLLEDRPHQSIKALAYDIGLRDVKNFSKSFKARFGKSPSEYLKEE